MTEWNRYISICGEIDDEIFVPELVKEKTLCPHQDYVIFNYPSENEINSFKQQYSNSIEAIKNICTLNFMSTINTLLNNLYKNEEVYVYENFADIVALYIFLNHGGYKINKHIFYRLTNSKYIPNLNKNYAERAVNYLLKSEFISESDKNSIISILKDYVLYERKKAIFDLSEKQKKELISSVGKLESIKKIVQEETSSFKMI